jgi:hypothetical protein
MVLRYILCHMRAASVWINESLLSSLNLILSATGLYSAHRPRISPSQGPLVFGKPHIFFLTPWNGSDSSYPTASPDSVPRQFSGCGTLRLNSELRPIFEISHRRDLLSDPRVPGIQMSHRMPYTSPQELNPHPPLQLHCNSNIYIQSPHL